MAGDRILVTLGTDVHPFERLISWCEELMATNGVEMTVQYGYSRPAVGADNHEMMPAEQFHRAIESADLVVAQGGPGGIMEARALGRFPLVVPRDPALGEHVDGHQQIFAAMLAERGLVRLAHTQDEFREAVDEMLRDGSGRFDPHTATSDSFAENLTTVLDRTHPRTNARQRIRRAWTMMRPPRAG